MHTRLNKNDALSNKYLNYCNEHTHIQNTHTHTHTSCRLNCNALGLILGVRATRLCCHTHIHTHTGMQVHANPLHKSHCKMDTHCIKWYKGSTAFSLIGPTSKMPEFYFLSCLWPQTNKPQRCCISRTLVSLSF